MPFVLKRPFLGILMLAGLGYLNPHRLCYGFIYSFPVVQLMVVFTLVGMLMSKEAKRMIWSREIALLAIFVAWMGITTTQAFYGALAFDQYIKVIKIQILTVMTLLMLTTPQRVHFFIWVVVMSLSFYGVKGGIFTILNGGDETFKVEMGNYGGDDLLYSAIGNASELLEMLGVAWCSYAALDHLAVLRSELRVTFSPTSPVPPA